MEAIFRVSSSMSAAWTNWVMLILLVLLAFNRFFLADIAAVFRNMFSRSERLYLDSTWQGRVIAWVFRAGVVAMTVYVLISKELSQCTMIGYWISFGLIAALFLIQYRAERLVSAVFLPAKMQDLVMEQRNCICNAIAAILWVGTLTIQWIDNVLIIRTLCYVFAGIYIVLLIVKSMLLFHKNALSILYVMLYIISLEVVPLVVTVSVIKHILQ